MRIRPMSVAGTFYPDSCKEIEAFIQKNQTSVHANFSAKAIISPHAGYIYSGKSANMVYSTLDKSRFSRVVIIGPSHRVAFKGASVALFDEYASPCGNLKIDTVYSKELIKKYAFLGFAEQIHQEHSTETQVPFIKHYLQDVEVVEIVYGDIAYQDLALVMQEILADDTTLLVISTDLSHFHNLQQANKLDNLCIEGVKNLDNKILESGCEACGMLGVKAIVSIASESQIIDYSTSYDASGDATRVVGYLSAILAI